VDACLPVDAADGSPGVMRFTVFDLLSLKGIVCSTLPVESKTRISPERKARHTLDAKVHFHKLGLR